MDRWFTHRLDSRTIGGRLETVKRFWRILAKYYLNLGDRIKIKYWPKDLELPVELAFSAYGIRELQDHVLSRREADHHLMEIIVGPIDNWIIELVIGEDSQSRSNICPWFDLSILDQMGNLLFYSHDNGAGTLMKLDENGLRILVDKGLDLTYLIEQPEYYPG